jgi:hypothetical protein
MICTGTVLILRLHSCGSCTFSVRIIETDLSRGTGVA